MTHGKSVVVPREATPKMMAATWDHEIDKSGGIESQNTRNARIWTAMLAAAPAPSSLAGGEVERPLGAAENGAVLLDRIEHNYDFACDGGELKNCAEWHEARRCFEVLSDFARHAALSPEAPARVGVEELIDQIRQSDGAAVTIMCDNPDFNGQPNSAVEVVADWTNWQTVRFMGDTVADALRNARDMVGGKIMGEVFPRAGKNLVISGGKVDDALLIQRANELAGLDGDFGELTTPYAKIALAKMAQRIAALTPRHEATADKDPVPAEWTGRGTDEDFFKPIKTALTKEAPAEGAGEAARIISCHLPIPEAPDTVCLPITMTAGDLWAIYAALRARSSAPEGRS